MRNIVLNALFGCCLLIHPKYGGVTAHANYLDEWMLLFDMAGAGWRWLTNQDLGGFKGFED